MNDKQLLTQTIISLIERNKEGAYWDFKCQHHTNKGDLVHDILCLANADHQGERYLIFGVHDGDFSLQAINKDTKRKTQADFACIFDDNAAKFFQNRFPDIYLEEIMIKGEKLDVLVIEDAPHKPYYLVERIDGVKPHHIYTRVCDKNTPKNSVAQPHEIERMWRQRFGLDLSPLERTKLYLSDPSGWSSLLEKHGCNLNFHHTIFPEFTICVAEAENSLASRQEWTQGEVRKDNNNAGYYDIHYHQTRLAHIHCVSFDDNKKSMVAPNWKPRGRGRFYYYEASSINYAVQCFYAAKMREDDSRTLQIRGQDDSSNEARNNWGYQMNIPVVQTGELEGFLGQNNEDAFIEPSSNEAEQYQLFLRNQLDFDSWQKRKHRGQSA